MKNQGFTLIELLVVITIIGLLASVFVFGYSGWTERARLANTKSFSQSVRSKLGYSVISQWTFDDETARDYSNNGHDGVINGAVSADGVMDKAMSFDGNDYIAVPNSSDFNVTESMTFATWIKPATLAGHQIYLSRGLPYNSRNTNNAFFSIQLSGLGQTSLRGTTVLAVDKWYYIVDTFDGYYMRIYLNGKLDEEKQVCGVAGYPACPATLVATTGGYDIGRHRNSTYYFNGLIDDIAIYKEAFTIAQVKKLYVEGLAKHNLVLK